MGLRVLRGRRGLPVAGLRARKEHKGHREPRSRGLKALPVPPVPKGRPGRRVPKGLKEEALKALRAP
jgi:hypothetical protein